MTQENATFWLGTENMNLEALHGEGKITSGRRSEVAKYHINPCMEDPLRASH